MDEGKLRAYLDQNLTPDERAAVEQYLQTHPEIQSTVERLRQTQNKIAGTLTLLAPASTQRATATQALNRFQSNLAKQPANPTSQVRERMKTMFSSKNIKRYQPAVIGLTLVTVVALLFSFAPVRAMAGNFLQIFRVQKVKVIPVDMNNLKNLENNAELEGLLQQLDPKADIISGGGEAQVVASLAEAADLVDFAPAAIGALPDGVGGADIIGVDEETIANVQLDKDLLDAIFEAAEIDVSLPDSINDAPIVIKKPAVVMQIWGPEENPDIGFMQLRSPEIEYPDDLDLNALGVAGLQLVGMSEAEARAIGATIDFANTLVLPVPTDASVSITEVSINGADGYLFVEQTGNDSLNGHGPKLPGVGVMWQNNGMTYLLQGQYSADEILAMAESVK